MVEIPVHHLDLFNCFREEGPLVKALVHLVANVKIHHALINGGSPLAILHSPIFRSRQPNIQPITTFPIFPDDLDIGLGFHDFHHYEPIHLERIAMNSRLGAIHSQEETIGPYTSLLNPTRTYCSYSHCGGEFGITTIQITHSPGINNALMLQPVSFLPLLYITTSGDGVLLKLCWADGGLDDLKNGVARVASTDTISSLPPGDQMAMCLYFAKYVAIFSYLNKIDPTSLDFLRSIPKGDFGPVLERVILSLGKYSCLDSRVQEKFLEILDSIGMLTNLCDLKTRFEESRLMSLPHSARSATAYSDQVRFYKKWGTHPASYAHIYSDLAIILAPIS